MKHKYIFHLKIYHHIYGREGGTLGCLGAGERPGDSVEDTQGLCNQAGGRSHQMRLVGPDANGRCQSVGQKIFQCCQPPATTTLPSISPPSTLPSPPFPAPARPDHKHRSYIIKLYLTLTVFCSTPLLTKYASPGRDNCFAGDHRYITTHLLPSVSIISHHQPRLAVRQERYGQKGHTSHLTNTLSQLRQLQDMQVTQREGERERRKIFSNFIFAGCWLGNVFKSSRCDQLWGERSEQETLDILQRQTGGPPTPVSAEISR